MENRAKPRFPRTLFSPFASCKSHNLISDVLHRRRPKPPVPFSSTSFEPLLPPASSSSSSLLPKPTNSPSMCRPRCPKNLDGMIRQSCILAVERWRIPEIRSPYDVVRVGSRCPPASPVSPLTRYMKLQKQKLKKHRNKEKEKKVSLRKTHLRREKSKPFHEDWFSSDDEREDDDNGETETETETESETLFSSKSVSIASDPDSAGSNLLHRHRKPPSARRREARKKGAALGEKVKGSFAVVKKSSDPYSDFRASMVEMITEKKMFEAKELEDLLQWFISHNSSHHHRIILEVFAEICEALFFNLCC